MALHSGVEAPGPPAMWGRGEGVQDAVEDHPCGQPLGLTGLQTPHPAGHSTWTPVKLNHTRPCAGVPSISPAPCSSGHPALNGVTKHGEHTSR